MTFHLSRPMIGLPTQFFTKTFFAKTFSIRTTALMTCGVLLTLCSGVPHALAQAASLQAAGEEMPEIRLSSPATPEDSAEQTSVLQAEETAGETSNVSSTTEALDSPVEPLLPNSYMFTLDPAGGATEQKKYSLDVRKTWETGHASVYINNHEVLKFRATLGGKDPETRAKEAANQLYQFLNEGNKVADIREVELENHYWIKAGERPLAQIDPLTAELAGMKDFELAKIWARQIRESFSENGQDPLKSSINLPNWLIPTGRVLNGMASWYGPGFHGRRAADGSRFDMNKLTAAHRTLPFGTLVRVINQRTQKSCIVKITDRGPFGHGRVIDLSKAAAKEIGLLSSGVAPVKLEILASAQQEAHSGY